jgi:hypothetical protein
LDNLSLSPSDWLSYHRDDPTVVGVPYTSVPKAFTTVYVIESSNEDPRNNTDGYSVYGEPERVRLMDAYPDQFYDRYSILDNATNPPPWPPQVYVPLYGGSLLWSSLNYWGLTFMYTWSNISSYNSAFPNGPPDCDPARGDWMYLPNRYMPNSITGTYNFIGGGGTHNQVGNSNNTTIWNQIIWIWVDFKQDPGVNTYLNGVPNLVTFYSGSIVYAYQNRWDSRDGRQMGLYKLATVTIANPSSSGSGGSHWYDFATNSWQSGDAPWLP